MARDSVEKHGGLDTPAFKKLCGLLWYVDGDYESPATFQSIREQLGSAQRPDATCLQRSVPGAA
jgi:glucose-6-phosphate 1-dehydrogenase